MQGAAAADARGCRSGRGGATGAAAGGGEDLRAAGHVAVAGEGEDEGEVEAVEGAGGDVAADGGDGLLGGVEVTVHVGGRDVEEGRGVAVGEQLLPEGLEGVDHAGEARELAEGDEPRGGPAARLADALVVEQPDPELEDPIQQGAVLLLALDDVREEHVGLARKEPSDVGLLHAQDNVARRKIVCQMSACRLILVV